MNFKILEEFQNEIDEFYDEQEEQKSETPIYPEQNNEKDVVFYTTKGYCFTCRKEREFEVYSFHKRKEIICSHCKTIKFISGLSLKNCRY